MCWSGIKLSEPSVRFLFAVQQLVLNLIGEMAKMKNLWKKESKNSESIYVDIFGRDQSDAAAAAISTLNLNCEITIVSKNDGFSIELRREGNELVRSRDFDAALLKYNEAIRLAVANTENLGMCYANRSICFMHFGKYSLCLHDIDLAKQNGYPIGLFPKLAERKSECLKMMEESKNPEPLPMKPELSFPPSSKNIGFVNAIETKTYGPGFKLTFANKNLKIGKTVGIEEPYQMISQHPFDHHHCANCFKADANLIPCPNCVTSMFCSDECIAVGRESFHDIECGIIHRLTNIAYGEITRSVFRTIVVALKIFGTIDKLMSAIESFRTKNQIDDMNVEKRNYFKFFGSHRIDRDFLRVSGEFNGHLKREETLHTILIENATLKPMLNTVQQQRFLGHLIIHHFRVTEQNWFFANNYAPDTYKKEMEIALEKRYASGIALDGWMMRPSCVPNIARIFVGRKIVYKVLRPIRSGEELFITYT